MAYFSIEYMINNEAILKELQKRMPEDCDTLDLKLHVDGMKPYSSSTTDFWPILGSIFKVMMIF